MPDLDLNMPESLGQDDESLDIHLAAAAVMA